MPVAGIQPFGGLPVSQKVGKDRIAIHRDSDLATMLCNRLGRAWRRRRTGQAIGDRVVVIAYMRVHMAAASVKGRNESGKRT